MGRRIGPIVVLLVLAPVCADLLFGATRLSTLPDLLPETLTCGVAALLIRDWARVRRRSNWLVLVLGLAFALASETLIVQTSLAQLGGVTDPGFGRALGVNWPYLIWAVGYGAVWGIVIPVHLSEMIFPERAGQPWLSPRARWVGLLVLGLGALLAWHISTRTLRPDHLGGSVYRPPLITLSLALAAVVLIIVAGFAIKIRPNVALDRADLEATLPPPVVVGIGAALLTLAWFAPVDRAWPPGVPATVPVLVSLAVAVLALVIIRNATVSRQWRIADRAALVVGALLASMAAGYVVNTLGGAGDLVFKIITNLAAVAGLIVLVRRTAATH